MKENILDFKVPRWSVFALDAMIVVFSIVTAYMLRFNFKIPTFEIELFKQAFFIILSVRMISFLIFRIHSGIIQYTSTRDASRIFLVLLGGTFLFALGNVLSFNFGKERYIIPYSIIILEFITTLMFLVSYRVFVKIAHIELTKPHSGQNRIMIFGAGEAGIITKRALEAEKRSSIKVVGYLDDNQKKNNTRIEGLKIYPTGEIGTIFRENEINQLVLAVQGLAMNRKQELIDICMEEGVEVLNVPPIQTWINGELSFKQIKSIRIEDLLGRDEIKLSNDHVKEDLKDKVVLISGAAGSIGRELVNQVLRFKPQILLMIDQAESPLFQLELETNLKARNSQMHYILADITDQSRMRAIFEKFKPDYVFHAAAYKHVPVVESNPLEAIRVNILGTKNLADLAVANNTHKFVMISTDKAVNPTNVMGASKRFAEKYVQSLNENAQTQFINTRFGNVLGSNGSVIPLFEQQIAKGGPITITDPRVTRFFMTIPEACQLVLEAGSMGEGGEIFVFDMGKSVRIIDLAKKMIRLSGLELGKDIQIRYTGLRPGEKLFEELLTQGENIKPTHHKKILKAEVEKVSFEAIQSNAEALKSVLIHQDVYLAVSILKKTIPEFKSENSEFGALD
jgi:FlaA1/EpsC-like NDP-sugar epimerase